MIVPTKNSQFLVIRCLRGASLLAISVTLLLSTTLCSQGQVVVENYNIFNRFEFDLPGTSDGQGGLNFNANMMISALDFAPGSVTFQGQPVDFDGTEADFLTSTYSGTANIPVTAGPATVDINFDFNVAGAFNGPFIIDLQNVELGPTFSASQLDVVEPQSTDLNAVAPSWSSSLVPELNGLDVFFVGRHSISNVSPTNAGFDTAGVGDILAVPEILSPAWLLGGLGSVGLRGRGRRQMTR